MHHCVCLFREVRGQLSGEIDLLLCGFQGSNLGHQVGGKHLYLLNHLTIPCLLCFVLFLQHLA